VKQLHLIMLYLIIYFKQFRFCNFFIYQINTFTTYPSLYISIYFLTTTKNGVCLYVKVGRGNETGIMSLEISVRNRLVSTQWSFIKGGSAYDNRRLSVVNGMIDISQNTAFLSVSFLPVAYKRFKYPSRFRPLILYIPHLFLSDAVF